MLEVLGFKRTNEDARMRGAETYDRPSSSNASAVDEPVEGI